MEQSVALLILRDYSILYNHTLQCKYTLLWSWWRDLNPWPDDYKSTALPTEPHQHIIRRLFFTIGVEQSFFGHALRHTSIKAQDYLSQLWNSHKTFGLIRQALPHLHRCNLFGKTSSAAVSFKGADKEGRTLSPLCTACIVLLRGVSQPNTIVGINKSQISLLTHRWDSANQHISMTLHPVTPTAGVFNYGLRP